METEKSLAMEIITDYKKANKRMFIIILVILGILFATFGYLVYTLKDIQTIEETSVDMDVEGSNNYIGGDNNGTYQSN